VACRPRDTWSGAEQLGWSVLLSPGESRASRCLLAGSEGPVVPGETPREPRPPLETRSSKERVRSLRGFESLWLETPRFETLIAESPYGDVIRYEG